MFLHVIQAWFVQACLPACWQHHLLVWTRLETSACCELSPLPLTVVPKRKILCKPVSNQLNAWIVVILSFWLFLGHCYARPKSWSWMRRPRPSTSRLTRWSSRPSSPSSPSAPSSPSRTGSTPSSTTPRSWSWLKDRRSSSILPRTCWPTSLPCSTGCAKMLDWCNRVCLYQHCWL